MKRCRILSIMLLLIMIFSMAISTNVYAAKKKIAISDKKITLEVGETHQLSVTGTKATVSWISADESIATVADDGTVTGKAEGTTKITGKIGSKKYSCKVTVKYVQKMTWVLPVNEYTEQFSKFAEYQLKSADIEEDDETITIIADADEVEKVKAKKKKEYCKMFTGIYDFDFLPDNVSINIYKLEAPIRIDNDIENINSNFGFLITYAYLNGHTEKELQVKYYPLAENNTYNTLGQDSEAGPVLLKVPTIEEIFKNSDPDC